MLICNMDMLETCLVIFFYYKLFYFIMLFFLSRRQALGSEAEMFAFQEKVSGNPEMRKLWCADGEGG